MVGMIDQAKTRSTVLRTPDRLLISVALPALCVLGFSVMLTVTMGGARDGYQDVGAGSHTALTAVGGLDYDLADMDGKAAEILLVGDNPGLAQGHAALYQAYENDEADADARLAVIGSGLDGVPGGTKAFVAVENGLDRYSSDAGQAFYLDGLDRGQVPARPPAAALAEYQNATAVMHQPGTGLLGETTSLLGAEQSAAGDGYHGRFDVLDRIRAAGVGLTLLVVAVLILVQVRLAREFRRVVNPLLALSTVLAVVFGVLLFSALGQASDSYTAQAVDETVVLWQNEAYGAQMKASETRWLLDLAGTTAAAHGDVPAESAVFDDDRAQVVTTSPAFAAFLADDGHLQMLAGEGADNTELSSSAAFEVGQNDQDFTKFVSDVNGSIAAESGVVAAAGERGANGLLPWLWLPSAWAVLMLSLIVGGVRPRFREYQTD